MRQPDCLAFYESTAEPPSPPQPKDPEVPAERVLLVLLIAVAVYETIALIKHWNTISQRIQHWSRARRLFRWGGVVLMTILSWHIFWGFPW